MKYTAHEILHNLPKERKPPLGIMPYFIWIETVRDLCGLSLESARVQRIHDLRSASGRYFQHGWDIPPEWTEELRNLPLMTRREMRGDL